jgi:CRISPR system Cascade subunit CasA
MNVAFDAWIPVVNNSGMRETASLITVLTEGERFADLSVRPHERVALMRLFMCVAHASLNGPCDYYEWCEVSKKLPDKAYKYLKEWDEKESFELFHPKKPWLQIAELKGVSNGNNGAGKTSPIAFLDFELSTGNTSTLNDHYGQMPYRQIEPERIAITLLTFLNFSPGGGSPVAQWETTKTSQVGNPDAPCLSQSMAHCLFRGRTISETIHLNLPAFDTIKRVYKNFLYDNKRSYSYCAVNLGRPVWELFPASPTYGSKQVDNAIKTYIGRLVPISRWIHLIPNSDQMYCCNGFKYDTYKAGFAAEPTAAVRLVTKKNKKGVESTERKVVKAEPAKALWRELSALLIKRSTDGLGGPLAMENAPYDTEFDFQVCAMARDQASMDTTMESVFHVTPSFHNNFNIYQAEVIEAEGYSRRLRWAIENYRTAIDNDWSPRVRRTQAKQQNALKDRLAQRAYLSYWTSVEKNLPLLMAHIEAIGSDGAIPSREAWRKMLFATACDAYRVSCGQGTPRQMRAFAKGWQKLTSRNRESESNILETKEEEI